MCNFRVVQRNIDHYKRWNSNLQTLDWASGIDFGTDKDFVWHNQRWVIVSPWSKLPNEIRQLKSAQIDWKMNPSIPWLVSNKKPIRPYVLQAYLWMGEDKTRAEDVNWALLKEDSFPQRKKHGACRLQLPLRTLPWEDAEALGSKPLIPFSAACTGEEELLLLNQCFPLPGKWSPRT